MRPGLKEQQDGSSTRASARGISSRPELAALRGQRGSVLLEVVLALVLFVAAAAVISAGINASLAGVERLRLNTHAVDLAVSVLSELQLGIKSAGLGGPQPFLAPYEGWTWEVTATPVQSGLAESSRLKQVEVTVRHDEPAVTYRLNQLLPLGDAKSDKDDTTLRSARVQPSPSFAASGRAGGAK